jgi:hypothetical protein
VRVDPAGDVDGFAAGAGFTGDLHVLVVRNQRGKAGANGRLVVGDEDAGHVPRW